MPRELGPWLLRGMVVGLIVLGAGGRVLMRIIAHTEHRQHYVLTVGGTLTVIFAGTVMGLICGSIYYLARRFIAKPWLRTALFAVVVEIIVWRGVSELLPRPKLMFLGLAVIYIAIIDVLGRRRRVPAA